MHKLNKRFCLCTAKVIKTSNLFRTIFGSYILHLDHPFYLAVQFHPEFLSRPLKPSPPYLGFLLASSGKLESYLQRGGRLSPRSSFNDIEEEVENVYKCPEETATNCTVEKDKEAAS